MSGKADHGLLGLATFGWALLLALAGCAPRAAPSTAGAVAGARDAERVLNIYNWSDYLDPTVLPAFEKEYGIHVNYDVFDSNEVLETKLLSGRTGYDIVVPSGSFLQRQIKAGVYQPFNKALLTNLGNLDVDMARRYAVYDPGNAHSVNYLWGSDGIGYNVKKVLAIMPDAPLDSLGMVLDPTVVARFKQCGVTILDAPEDVVSSVLLWLGRNPDSEAPEDLDAVERALVAIRPYLRYINSSRYIDDLANGEICLALGWSGDVGQAAARARESGNGVELAYRRPTAGAMIFFDMLAIPADAPHPLNAHLFIDYMLRADVAARNSSAMHFATTNAAAYPLIAADVIGDANFYPPPGQRSRLHPNLSHNQAYTRSVNRVWTRFKSGL
jgi:putrescine transport system substrate-binding protein